VSARQTRTLRRVALNVVAIGVIVLFAFPVFWMASTAFKQPGDIQSYEPKFLPIPPTLDNFQTAVTRPHFPEFLRNSLIVSLSTVVLALVVGLMAAMAVARARFRGRKSFLLLVVVAQMAPFEALLIPMYLVFRQADLLNQLPALIVTYFIFTLPFTIWTLRGFIAGIPIELEEAALVDGANRVQAFWRVVLPLLAPGLVATSIFGFITAWNEFLYAYVLMQDTANFTLPVWLATFKTAFGTDWGGTMAASTLFTLPVLVFFLLIQNRMVGGVTAGAVKG
jgi:N,N'-diacetylchitobiose transport system permease protein